MFPERIFDDVRNDDGVNFFWKSKVDYFNLSSFARSFIAIGWKTSHSAWLPLPDIMVNIIQYKLE